MKRKGKRFKIAGFRIIYGPSTIGRIYQEVGRKINETEVGLELRYSQPPAQGMPLPSPDWFEFAKKEADAVFFGFPPEFKALYELFEGISKELNKPVVPVTAEVASIGNLPPDEIKRAIEYHLYGGRKNIEQFFLWLGELAGKLPAGISHPPQKIPWAGIYHPKSESIWTDLEEYFRWYGKRRPLIGLLFPRIFWIEDNLGSFNAIIEEIEKRGGGVIPVFSDGWFGQIKNDDVIRKFFMHNEKPVIDILISYSAFFLKSQRQEVSIDQEPTDILKELDVPVLKMIHAAAQTEEEWRESPEGLNLPQVIISITLPEFDGLIEPILVGTLEDKSDFSPLKPIPEQVEYLVERVFKWVELKQKSNSEKKVAFVLLNSPCKSVEATVGTAFGLDSLESLARILQKMKEAGYKLEWVPKNGKELIEEIMARKALPDFRWTTIEEIVEKGGAAAKVSLERYLKWFSEFPAEVQEKVCSSWGNPKDLQKLTGIQKLSLGLYNGEIVIPGIITGNVFIGVQPKRGCAGSRCDGEVCKILHDPDVPPPHQWLAWHKWIEEEFKADVIVHIGTHGVLELLPGKTTALSETCFPRISLGKIPHLYIYNITNPMEAVIAKRRGSAGIIDHMPPVLATFQLQDELADLEELLEDYQKAVSLNEKARAAVLLEEIKKKAKEANLISEEKELDPIDLHEKLSTLRESQFREGLHILGQAPEGKALAELINSVLRVDQPDCPSLRRALAECIGLNYEQLIKSPDALTLCGLSGGRILSKLEELGKVILSDILDLSQKQIKEAIERAKKHIAAFAEKNGLSFRESSLLFNVLKKALKIIPLVHKTDQEISNLLRGFEGKFIEPGASGALARGKIEVLPTGRNMYSIDPWRIPTPAAWEVGKHLANELIARYVAEEGKYPESIGFTLRAMDPYRADGEMLAQILYTLGVEPVWSAGRVVTLKPLPLEALGRPRIDCTVNLSSILRDGMPRAFELIDQAVQMVAELPEPPEQNFVRKHVLEREKELLSKHNAKEARRLATFRVFSSAPGTYGTGVELAVASSAWKEEKDLAAVYFHWTSYAYGNGVYAQNVPDELIENCRRVVITFEKFDSDEIDLLDCCHIYGMHGGFTNAVKVASGKKVMTLFGDTRDPARPVIRTLREELSRIARTRLLNPAWIEGKKKHGYKGAGDISSRVNHIYGWQATTREVENWVFDGIAKQFLLNEENRRFFKENNPYALEEIARRLIEAAERGLWQPAPDVKDALKNIYLEIEGWMEERMEEVKGEFQGSEVSIMSTEDLFNIGEKVKEIKSKLR